MIIMIIIIIIIIIYKAATTSMKATVAQHAYNCQPLAHCDLL